jgi:hypothetical protein
MVDYSNLGYWTKTILSNPWKELGIIVVIIVFLGILVFLILRNKNNNGNTAI